jgi:hypothetical protein
VDKCDPYCRRWRPGCSRRLEQLFPKLVHSFTVTKRKDYFSVQTRIIPLIASITLATACGGGGGGGSSQAPVGSSPPPATGGSSGGGGPGFASGTFEAFQNFEQQCANPRSGFDSRGRPFPDTQGATIDENNWLRSWSNELYLWYDEITDVDPASLSTSPFPPTSGSQKPTVVSVVVTVPPSPCSLLHRRARSWWPI